MGGLGHPESAPGEKGKLVRTSPEVLGLLCSGNQVEPLNKGISQAYWVTIQAAIQAGIKCQAGLQVGLDGATTTFPQCCGQPCLVLTSCSRNVQLHHEVFSSCVQLSDSCPSLHLTDIFSWAQLQMPHSGVLLMLCSPRPPDHTQQATALPGSQINNYTTEPVPSQTKPLPHRLISQSRYSNFKDLIMISLSSTWHWYNPAPFNGTWLLLAFSVLINNQGKQHQHQVFNHWNLSLVFRAWFSNYYSVHCVPLINSALRTDFRGSAAQGAQHVICTVLIKYCLCRWNFYQCYGKEIASTWNCMAGLLLVELHQP